MPAERQDDCFLRQRTTRSMGHDGGEDDDEVSDDEDDELESPFADSLSDVERSGLLPCGWRSRRATVIFDVVWPRHRELELFYYAAKGTMRVT